MRSIFTKKEKLKKQKRNTLIVSIILIVVICLSIFGIVANSFGNSENSNEVDYNGYKFYSSGDFWVLEEGDFKFVFLNNPKDLENMTFEANPLKFLPSYSQKVLYLSSEDSVSSYQIYSNLEPFLTRIQYACLDEKNCTDNLPIKNCTENFVVIRKSETNKILQQDKCVFIEGKEQDLYKLTEIFLLKILGVRE